MIATVSRMAFAAPVSAAILGSGIAAATATPTEPSRESAGIHVPAPVVGAGGGVVAGVAIWASYRRQRIFAD